LLDVTRVRETDDELAAIELLKGEARVSPTRSFVSDEVVASNRS